MTNTHKDSTPAAPREFIASWDVCEIAQSRIFILQEDDPSLSDEQAFQEALLDEDIIGMEWDWLLEDMEPVLRAIAPAGRFYAQGRNMGWRHRSGWKVFTAADAQTFFDALLPSADCTFTVERAGNALHITNYHHDAPTGEHYVITAAAADSG